MCIRDSLQTYLLDFERTTNEIFNPELDGVVTENGINLGIRDREVEYRTDDQDVYKRQDWIYERKIWF